MATALIVTFTATVISGANSAQNVALTSQRLNFVDVRPAERALEEIKKAHEHLAIDVVGVILKDVII
jgi:hypothetical protein